MKDTKSLKWIIKNGKKEILKILILSVSNIVLALYLYTGHCSTPQMQPKRQECLRYNLILFITEIRLFFME